MHFRLARVVLAPFVPAALAALASAQDILHYKFDGGCGSTVVNHALGTQVGPGTIVSALPGAPAAAWTGGQWRTALAGGGGQANCAAAGWNVGTFTGDFSISFWIRNHPGNPGTIGFGYLFGVSGPNFRCFTGSSGRLFLSGFPGSLTSATNLTTQLNAGWVHCAVTIDQTNGIGTWYVNGAVDVSGSVGAVSFTGTDFAVGARDATGSNASFLDTDEFLFTARVLSAAEVAALALDPQAGHGRYGSSCGPSLDGNGTRPFLGNAGYGLVVDGTAVGLAWIVFGTNRCALGGAVPLPVHLGAFTPLLAGCEGHVDTDLGTLLTVIGGAPVTIGFPPPAIPSLSGFYLVGQAVTYDAGTNTLRTSNGLGIGVGI
jgi:hypothetical protein